MDKEEIDDSLLFDLAKDQSFQGEIAPPAASSTLSNPLCGDEVTFFLLLNRSDEIEKIRFKTKGCFICKATAAALSKFSDKKKSQEVLSLLTKFRKEFVSGEPETSDILEFKLLHELRAYPTRAKCVLLPFEALTGILSGSTGANHSHKNKN